MISSLQIFAAEKPPDSLSLGGFSDRTFRIESDIKYYVYSQYITQEGNVTDIDKVTYQRQYRNIG